MTRRKKWPEDANEAREDAIATALDIRLKLKEAMELLELGKNINLERVERAELVRIQRQRQTVFQFFGGRRRKGGQIVELTQKELYLLDYALDIRIGQLNAQISKGDRGAIQLRNEAQDLQAKVRHHITSRVLQETA